jgi:excisionase family DNA binding protein
VQKRLVIVVIGALALLCLALAGAGLAFFDPLTGAAHHHHLVGLLAAAPVVPFEVAPAVYAVPQVCHLLSIGRSTCYELISRGHLQTKRIPGLTSMRITAESVHNLLASAPAANSADDSYRGAGVVRRQKDGLPPSPRRTKRGRPRKEKRAFAPAPREA